VGGCFLLYDVAIVGGGPAGATLARLLAKDYKVLVIDKRRLDSDPQKGQFTKCCGGLIAPDAQKMLAKMGLALPQNVLVSPQIFAVRTIDINNKLERFYQRFYFNMDREKFDRWLISLLPDEVDLRCGSQFKHFEQEEDAVRIVLTQNNKTHIEHAKILVGADGAHSLVRKQLGIRGLVPREYISVQAKFTAKEIMPYFTAIFDKEITDYYSWIIPKEQHLLLGTALKPRENVSSKFELLQEKMKRYGIKLNKQVEKEGAFILRPMRVRQLSVGQSPIALIGEAGGWISPSSAEGLSYAFRSASYLAQAIKSDFKNYHKHYLDNITPLRRNIRLKNLKAPFMYNSQMRKWVMLSGLQSMQIDEN